ncbi:hypothetical protein B5181_35785, partial [Streptomyces sp. 4F]
MRACPRLSPGRFHKAELEFQQAERSYVQAGSQPAAGYASFLPPAPKGTCRADVQRQHHRLRQVRHRWRPVPGTRLRPARTDGGRGRRGR